MKIFALNLALEFKSATDFQSYRFPTLSLAQLMAQLQAGPAFRGQQFYVQAPANADFIRQLFDLQAHEAWRELEVEVCLLFENQQQAQWAWQAFEAYFKPVAAAGGLVENEEGEYLGIYNRGRWTLPKGHIDAGETPQQAALREVQEETGLQELELKQKIGETWHTYQKRKQWELKTTHWYHMFASSNQPLHPQAKENIEAAKWISREEWLSGRLPMYPQTRHLLALAFSQPLQE
ncbi:MAG: NUDIX domain-containing protein [Bacteroidetes bacterium]|nr:MAG: NUDIX domain-containing protein [Bacteroidota bacterium]